MQGNSVINPCIDRHLMLTLLVFLGVRCVVRDGMYEKLKASKSGVDYLVKDVSHFTTVTFEVVYGDQNQDKVTA